MLFWVLFKAVEVAGGAGCGAPVDKANATGPRSTIPSERSYALCLPACKWEGIIRTCVAEVKKTHSYDCRSAVINENVWSTIMVASIGKQCKII